MKTRSTISYNGPSLIKGNHSIKVNSDRNGVRIELVYGFEGGLAEMIAAPKNEVLELDWDAAEKACDPRIENATSEDSSFGTIEEFAVSWAREILMKQVA